MDTTNINKRANNLSIGINIVNKDRKKNLSINKYTANVDGKANNQSIDLDKTEIDRGVNQCTGIKIANTNADRRVNNLS